MPLVLVGGADDMDGVERSSPPYARRVNADVSLGGVVQLVYAELERNWRVINVAAPIF